MTRNSARRPVRRARERGVAAILAMMFLVIFGSLAAAMAIVAQGNLVTADSHLKINRSLAASETGMRYLMFRVNEVARTIKTRDGLIDENNAPGLWTQLRGALMFEMTANPHNAPGTNPTEDDTTLIVGPIELGDNHPSFNATFTPHPITGENYDSALYQREPYSTMDPPITSANPLDPTWIRIRVDATDGPDGRDVTRSIQMDFKLDKKIRYAILSKSRVMIGRNVMIDGPIGSRFMDTHLENGHPIQMESNFRGLDPGLDANLDLHLDDLDLYDKDRDNRINLNQPSELPTDPTELQAILDADTNGDGYVDAFDYFADHYDANADGQITPIELDTSNNQITAELLELIDTFGDPYRYGYNDGVIDDLDRYVKVKGELKIKAAVEDWEDGAADPTGTDTGRYRDFLQGSIRPGHRKSPLTFQATEVSEQDFEPADFDVSTFRGWATGDLSIQAAGQAALYDPANPDSPQPLGQIERESVPYNAAHPYDYYDRPVYENMTFTDIFIPKGTNAVFKNCTFEGVTFVETEMDNVDTNFNYAGMSEADGTAKHPDIEATVGATSIADTKTVANNLRFHDCTFEGSVVSDAPPKYTHVRNKITFTGRTRFDIEGSAYLATQPVRKEMYKRSTILTPHYSIEMGTFDNPTDTNEDVELSGTIVAGVLDMRGRIKINGQILTTFEPQLGTAPVIDNNSPQFNTTLGYFGSDSGDMEAELPGLGMGMIQLRYNPDLALPDGIDAPIELRPVSATYFEGGH